MRRGKKSKGLFRCDGVSERANRSWRKGHSKAEPTKGKKAPSVYISSGVILVHRKQSLIGLKPNKNPKKKPIACHEKKG